MFRFKGMLLAAMVLMLIGMLSLTACANVYVAAGGSLMFLNDQLVTQTTQAIGGTVTSVATQSTSGGVVIGTDSGVLSRYSSNLSTLLGTVNGLYGISSVVTMSNDSVAFGNSGDPTNPNPVIRVYDQTLGAQTAITGGTGPTIGLAISPIGDAVNILNNTGTLWRLNPAIDSWVGAMCGGFGTVVGIDTQSTGHTLIVGDTGIWRLKPDYDPAFEGSYGGLTGVSAVAASGDDTVYLGTTGGILYRFDAGLVNIISQATGLGAITATSVMDDGTVLVGNADGTLLRMNADLSSTIASAQGLGRINGLDSLVTVPEPTSLLAFGTGLIGLFGFAKRRRK